MMLDPLFPFKIDYLTFDEIGTFASENYYRILYVIQGTLVCKSVHERKILKNHEVLFENGNIPATYGLQKNTAVYSLSFSDTFLEQLLVRFHDAELLRSFFPKQEPTEPWKRQSIFKLPEDADTIEVIIREIHNEYKIKPILYATMIYCKLIELFIVLARTRAPYAPKHSETDRKWNINTIVEHIEEHYAEEFSLNELASRLGFAPGYFSRLFHEKTGMPLFEFINSIRIRKACILLKRNNMSIIEVAYAVGYNNLSFFNRYFRKIMNMSPREYKNL